MKKAVIVLLVLVLVLIFWPSNPASQTLGGVNRGQSYQATSTASMGSVMNLIAGNRPVELGSVVVASTSATTFTIWDATSTTDTASTSVATLKASVGEGTYTFDAQLKRGLVVELPSGFDGDYVITWRP